MFLFRQQLMVVSHTRSQPTDPHCGVGASQSSQFNQQKTEQERLLNTEHAHLHPRTIGLVRRSGEVDLNSPLFSFSFTLPHC
ncbi:hypothetical protein RRG08_024558 [Elysia crispata]|uniref:Uncharacterized protein n=1 Tax=Elysia crispata TaxID=231223 RepID=A0AAE0ZXH7_9GAST|nr:hypothetical protein RRG08_024558 [Elysia crispata]